MDTITAGFEELVGMVDEWGTAQNEPAMSDGNL
jgi:hypothetical protein